MNYLVDTNVISEFRKTDCNDHVRSFVESLANESLYISAISLGEIQYGVAKMEASKKKHELLVWVSVQLPDWFSERIIPVDSEISFVWGSLRAEHKATLPAVDSLLAATALTHHLTILTRNEKDFENISGLNYINPWNV
ncbi:MAG: type II toxin-antitoxin system VapC family toxin [Termitinemataceae bacterium]|nr:MAG: type II toxin-antitoxin system VapC family toxin [Termitinemataceae bacterium]